MKWHHGAHGLGSANTALYINPHGAVTDTWEQGSKQVCMTVAVFQDKDEARYTLRYGTLGRVTKTVKLNSTQREQAKMEAIDYLLDQMRLQQKFAGQATGFLMAQKKQIKQKENGC